MQLDVSDIKSGVAECKKQIKEAKDSFDIASSGMENWSKSSEGLQLKLQQLARQQAAQEKIVAGYGAEIERVSKLEGNHTRQLEVLKQKLTQAEKAFKVTQGQIQKYNASLLQMQKTNISNTIRRVQESTKKLTDELKKATKAQLAQNLAILANPYALAASAIGFLIGKVTDYVQKQKEANEVSQEDVNIKQEQVKNTIEYTAALSTYTGSLSRIAKSYSEAIAQDRAFQKSLDDLKQSIVSEGLTLTEYANSIERTRDALKKGGNTDILTGEFFAFDSEMLETVTKNYEAMKEPLLELVANMIDLGKTDKDVTAILSQLGISQEFINEVFQDATKAVNAWNEANKKAEAPKTENTKTIDLYSTTALAQAKKDYDDFMKWLQAKRFKLAKEGAEADTSVIDAQIEKYKDGARIYNQVMRSMKKTAKQENAEIEADTRSMIQRIADSLNTPLESLSSSFSGVKLSIKGLVDYATSHLSSLSSSISDIIGDITDIYRDFYQKQLDEIEANRQAQEEAREHDLTEIEKQYMNYEITLEEFLERKKQLEETDLKAQEDRAEEEKEIKKKQQDLENAAFAASQANAIAQVWINTAAGIVGYWASAAQLGPIAGPIAAAALTATMTTLAAVQTGIISAQTAAHFMAKGGVVDSPTLAVIGENGREAVVPLENNMEWLNEIGEKLARIQSAKMTIPTNNDYSSNYNAATYNNSNSFTQIINAPKTPSRLELYRDGQRLLRLSKI